MGHMLQHMTHRVGSESVSTSDALGRIVTGDVPATENLPTHPRSAMDGYSVRAQDTFGATEGLPAYIDLVGEVPMGSAPQVSLSAGQAARAYTGGLLADSADAVVMVENTQQVDDSTIEVLRPVAPGENVIQAGEDVRIGDVVVAGGHVLRSQDIGGLLALGITEISVAKKPRVVIVSTGDELVAPQAKPEPGQIRDINTYTISSLVTRSGGEPTSLGLVGDDLEAQSIVARDAKELGDVIVFSAGSSVSSRDLTAQVLDNLGSPGVLSHGISHKPGKPTVLAVVDGKPAFGLPGNPVSAMIVFDLLVRPTLYRLCGCDSPPPIPTTGATLTRDIPSVSGREDYVQVRLIQQNGALMAEPVFGKSNLIYTLVRADGTVRVPLDRGGLYAGEEVSVSLH